MARLPHSQTYTREFLMVQSSDHITGITGASPTVTLSKSGAAYAGAAGTVTEVANGVYKIAFTTADTNTLGDLAVHCTAGSADPTDFVDQIVAGIWKNVPFNNFGFHMTDSTNHAPVTGKTVTVTRSLDGGAFAAGALSAVTEVANGLYAVNFAASDLNANCVVFRATATGCDDTLVEIFPQ